jgi:hypothetical protein
VPEPNPHPTAVPRHALIAVALFLCFLPLTRGLAERFCINYSATPDLEELKRFDEVIVSPYARVDVHSLVRSAQIPYAYLSVVEIAADARYREDAIRRGIPLLNRNETWNSDVVDVSSPAWTQYVVDVLAADAAKMGFRGFFLDTADSIALAERHNPGAAKEYRAGLVRLIKTLRLRFPKHRVILNRGFSVLGEVINDVDGVLVESLFRKYDFNQKAYVAESPQGTEWLNNLLGKVRQAGREVYVVDYVDENDGELARKTAARIEQLGYHAFISTVALDGKYLHLPEANMPPPPGAVDVPRFALALFGNNHTDKQHRIQFPLDSSISRFLQMPLEYFGYHTHFLNVWTDDLPPDLGPAYSAVILDRQISLPRERENAIADWLVRQKESGKKILFFGKIPFETDMARERIVKAFDFAGSAAQVEGINSVRFVEQSPFTNFEVANQITPADFLNLLAPAGSEVWLTLAATTLKQENIRFQPVFIAPWGGALLDPHITFMRPDEDEMWKVDPFAFVERFLGPRLFPAPDTTTRDGVRIFFAHIDGDGFRHKTTVQASRRSGDLLFEKIVERYPFPITCSMIEAEVTAIIEGQDRSDVELLTQQARDVFRSEKVEAGSHSFSHPYYWIPDDKTQDIYERRNLELDPRLKYGQAVDYRREVVGSIEYIERNLLPPGKHVEIMLWSGNCRPGVEALRWCRSLGVENMNGGDTAITRKNPSLTRVFPSVVPWGDELQVYCAHQNENVYRFRWKGGADPNSVFWSGFVLALDSFQKTETPRRLKPVNIYYHWYSGDNLPSMNALKQLYEWCLTQELHAITAAPFARLARDARSTRVFTLGPDRWLIRNDGFCRTLTLPWTGKVPDLTRSRGLAGWRRVKDRMYLHTTGARETEVALATNPSPHIYLESSTAELRLHSHDRDRVAFHLKDFRPARVVFAGLPPAQSVGLVINGRRHELQSDAEGRLKMELPAEATVAITPR